MSQMSFNFTAARPVTADMDANDNHRLPASPKQIAFAKQIAARKRELLPDDVITDRQKLSDWIDANKSFAPNASRFSNYPSSKQVAFAERLARIKRRAVPDECFRDKTLMSRWIDANR